ncbi:exodeoxyribonuclease V subunit alpha [Candidatus Profftia sp. (ex Adelges kitamiensis)]|uniref:exodeoxyribonuclease V subunit alpha n=1 Tax=Candidatus Profftia sp. (ex Adelges kitamiensis) TaxID=2864218 RepID=UPI001CE3773B|nr:exodeoxyribonuclease V subunit alpha [Candidatus Profftia sp. (ex Adelges kitamiensis)]
MIFNLLLRMQERNHFCSLDIHFARLIASAEQPHLALAAALVSQAVVSGHVCLPLRDLIIDALIVQFPDFSDELKNFFNLRVIQQWQELLLADPKVSDGSYPAPLILQNNLLYLQRLWLDEVFIAQFLADSYTPLYNNSSVLSDILSNLFPSINLVNEINWQKVAVGVATTCKVSVISGGPGTGKTTTVAKLLAALILLYPKQRLRIKLAAPTGKAAARLIGVLRTALIGLHLNNKEIDFIPLEAYTLHRLLGATNNSKRLRFYRENILHVDVLVVDEASLISLSMMSNIISALPKYARLILLGDRDQLDSVEAGSVFRDICYFSTFGFRPTRAQELSTLCRNTITAGVKNPNIAIRDSICLLKKNYRFASDSGISQLAAAVKTGNITLVRSYLDGRFNDITWIPMTCEAHYNMLIKLCVEGYSSMLDLVHKQIDVTDILEHFSHFRLLCALREGPFGQSGLNKLIEIALAKFKLINKFTKEYKHWYNGRPVMITSNDSSLGLFNGDIGIAISYAIRKIRVYFKLSDSSIKCVHPGRLPQVETAYAMTVHKSQGSEFKHIILVLPTDYSPIVTRELFYTAITRAKKKLTIFSKEKIIMTAVRTTTSRKSGLIERILNTY